MLYSKNGSIPKPQPDTTPGWIEVAEPPVAPEGMEVVWWYPPGWVVRPLQPGANFSWSQSEARWVEFKPSGAIVPAEAVTFEPTPAIETTIQTTVEAATAAEVVLSMPSASATLGVGE